MHCLIRLDEMMVDVIKNNSLRIIHSILYLGEIADDLFGFFQQLT